MRHRYRERLRKNSKPGKLVPQKKVLTLGIDCSSVNLFLPEKPYATYYLL